MKQPKLHGTARAIWRIVGGETGDYTIEEVSWLHSSGMTTAPPVLRRYARLASVSVAILVPTVDFQVAAARIGAMTRGTQVEAAVA